MRACCRFSEVNRFQRRTDYDQEKNSHVQYWDNLAPNEDCYVHCASDLFDSMCNKAFTTNLPPLIFNFTVKT